MTAPYPLYSSDDHHDACGVGFIADRHGRSTHRVVRMGVTCLHGLDHRGAKAADGTGDGAGVMTRIPYRILERVLAGKGLPVPPRSRMGLVMAFLPPDDVETGRKIVEDALVGEEIDLISWRKVPVGPNVLGEAARASMPAIQQAIVSAPHDDIDRFERSMFLARKMAERVARSAGLDGFAIPSASARTVVYKGLFTASTVEGFYWDLIDPMFESDFVIFHQRYSTNTQPSWEYAQPFHVLAHNGEINTVAANRSWMAAREADIGETVWGERSPDLIPLVNESGSDSASLDDAFEVLLRSGRSIDHVKEMLIPAAWENVADLDPALGAFYEYHAFLTEPWDGPAAIAASDGVQVIAGLDRNGLRPARWTETPEFVLVASEAGLVPSLEVDAIATGQLGAGEVIAVDLATGEVRHSDRVKGDLAARRPYGDWISTQTLYVRHPFDDVPDDGYDADALARVFGYTAEERRLLLHQMASGTEPVLSMGHDTGLAVLADTPQRLPRFFHQAFAQVTNPPMDPIRERLVMSLRTYLGARGSIIEETAEQARLVELASPVISYAEVQHLVSADGFESVWLPATFPVSAGESGLGDALDALCDAAESAVRAGANLLVLSDQEVSEEAAPIPIVLATGAVHHRLISQGLRLRASIVVVSGEPRDAHDLACLVGFGASAVNPYLAIEQVRMMASEGEVPVSPIEAQENYRSVLEKGLLKIMSKMGICTISAYRGSELFEAIGLDQALCDVAFRYVKRRVGGIGMAEIARSALELHAGFTEGAEGPGGYYKHRRGGMRHVNSPKAVLAVQKAVRSGEREQWDKYLDEVQNDRPALMLRDLIDFRDVEPVPLDQVEPAEAIMRRFSTAAMSLGALSREAHETLAEAMNFIGGLSNSGEGGEDPQRFGTPRNSSIKQIASGRFGVTPGYLASAEEYQIKMAQGSKPGEGGQLPGHKVTKEIARLRHTEPGITLISPPPHHDIYSIEDLAQLIYDLKTFKPLARVSVKLVSGPGVGTIAVGVAKAKADVVLISGNSGGTGASPMVSIKHAGSPWELGLAEAHQALVANGLRSTIYVEADGGIRTGRDVIVAALLGADRYGFGTLPLLALGCKMVRQCHENTCPVGIATQAEDLRAKYTGAADQVVELFRHLAEEVRAYLAALGARSIDEILGRADLLEARTGAPDLGFADLLARADFRPERSYRTVGRSRVGEALSLDARRAVRDGAFVELSYPVENTDRAVGTRLSGEIADRHGDTGLPPDTIRVWLSGTAGQSLGAFLAPGVSLRVTGTANDYVGKGMGGGVIAIRPSVTGDGIPHGAGNACLYGATSGALYVGGSVGQRFAVRNSGATAVVEGAGDHCAEYMTGGRVVVLGHVGRNVAAGMTGGVLFVWDPDGSARSHFAESAPMSVRPSADDVEELRAVLVAHVAETGSALGSAVLDDLDSRAGEFWVLRPCAP